MEVRGRESVVSSGRIHAAKVEGNERISQRLVIVSVCLSERKYGILQSTTVIEMVMVEAIQLDSVDQMSIYARCTITR